ncbi:glycoside hydrolase family 2 TIM barrel-domain containing protein [Saccharicrinis sp. FJH54]|uniref:glycoside hydrolase family 2 TIM barrel-domain containing protein n=1 Tax=Saccharicrinis sp. FJH54 TaxID=3344665 RepID=UPI0035D4F0A7
MKRSLFLIALVFVFLTGCKTAASDSADPARKQLFDFDWKFAQGDHPGAEALGFDDSGWRKLDLPHDWSIEGKSEKSNPSEGEGGFYPMGTGWYRKTFEMPDAWTNKLVSAYFGGVYMDAEVFINGHSLGIQPYGYTSFVRELTPYLNADGKNVIAVKVDNSRQKNCRWYSGSGIYRHVWMIVTDSVHIGQWGVAITTPEVSETESVVKVVSQLINTGSDNQELILETGIFDKNNAASGSNRITVVLPANGEKEIEQLIKVKNPLLWSTEEPNLYTARVQVKKGDQIVDQVVQRFGIRSVSFSAGKGFLLNGKPVLLNGGCVHHDNGCLGAKAYDRAEERKVELLKAAGFNAVRTSHNPPSEAFLDACDRLGLLVIDEAFDGWRTAKAPQAPYDYSLYFDQWWEHDLSSMVLRDRNHPSIIMWSIGNEIIERTSPEAVETAKMLAGKVREIDPTRPVTSAMTTWGQGWEIFDPLMAAHDVCGYNYQLNMAVSDHERVPDRIIVNTESYPRNAFHVWNLVSHHNYIIGDFVWTAMDYLGESGIGRYYYPGEPHGEHWQANLYPWHGAYCGDIDLTGWRKPISHYRSMLYNDTEKLYMAVREPNPENGEIRLTMWAVWPTWESWTWPGHEGKDMEVEVYSRYPAVRLYLNGALIGEKKTGLEQEFKALFTLPYKAGSLKAVGVEDDKETETTELNTVGKASLIQLTPDRNSVKADGQDLSYVTVEITDDKGSVDPNAGNLLNFSIDGPGEIIGVDNADLKDTTSYVGTIRNAWHGRAMVVVKSKREPGTIKLTATAKGLGSGEAKIVTSR